MCTPDGNSPSGIRADWRSRCSECTRRPWRRRPRWPSHRCSRFLCYPGSTSPRMSDRYPRRYHCWCTRFGRCRHPSGRPRARCTHVRYRKWLPPESDRHLCCPRSRNADRWDNREIRRTADGRSRTCTRADWCSRCPACTVRPGWGSANSRCTKQPQWLSGKY